MQKRSHKLILLVTGMFLLAGLESALMPVQPRGGTRLEIKAGSTGLGFYGSYHLPSAAQLGNGTFGGMLSFQLGLGRHLGLEIAASYSQFKTTGSESGLQEGSLLRIPLQLSLKGRLPLGKLTIFLLGGAHYALNQFSLKDTITNNWSRAGFTVEEAVESGLGFQGGLGCEFAFSRSLALGFDARYLVAKGEGEFRMTDHKTGESASGPLSEIQLDQMVFSLGLIWYL